MCINTAFDPEVQVVLSKRDPKRTLVANIIFRFDVGGLENGMINVINNMPTDRYQHVVICLHSYSDFRFRLRDSDVKVFAIGKKEGIDLGHYIRLWQLLRLLKPDIVHTRNLVTLESAVVAWAAGIKRRVHSEHGWGMYDLYGRNKKYTFLRKILRPFPNHFIALSLDQLRWLREYIGISGNKISHICNGVDLSKFDDRARPAKLPFAASSDMPLFIIGTVGRMVGVKDQVTLAKAFIELTKKYPEKKTSLRLIMIGDGPLREQAQTALNDAGLTEQCWLPGWCDEVPALMRAMNVFVLPSLNEGISNTILEAMASGLPVIATNVGGNPELIEDGRTGYLVPPSDTDALAEAMSRYFFDAGLAEAHGSAGRRRVETEFSLQKMVDCYQKVYETLITG